MLRDANVSEDHADSLIAPQLVFLDRGILVNNDHSAGSKHIVTEVLRIGPRHGVVYRLDWSTSSDFLDFSEERVGREVAVQHVSRAALLERVCVVRRGCGNYGIEPR